MRRGGRTNQVRRQRGGVTRNRVNRQRGGRGRRRYQQGSHEHGSGAAGFKVLTHDTTTYPTYNPSYVANHKHELYVISGSMGDHNHSSPSGGEGRMPGMMDPRMYDIHTFKQKGGRMRRQMGGGRGVDITLRLPKPWDRK